MKVISVLQLKGGSGRSTASTSLAGELSKRGRTALLDADAGQGTASSWAAVRQDQTGNLAVQGVSSPRELTAALAALKGTTDYLVIDGPPRLAEMTRAALLVSDLVLVPLGPSLPEIWATGDFRNLMEEAEQHRRVTAKLLWTRYRPHLTLAQELHREAEKAIGLRALTATLGLRVAYVEALGTGKTAAEVGDRAAKEEVTALVREVLRLL